MSTNLQSIKRRYGIIGSSRELEQALDLAARVSNTDLTVLITGESGVGKEVFSKVIHNLSARKHNNFIAINCGAIPSGTINSELFGHDRGAFTGASSDRKGYFETVNGGTIFLDEIGEMPLDTQAYLLRVLESGEFIRVGSSVVQKTDVRIIAATNVDLQERVRKNKFREDLYYRLNTVPIQVPSLRDREDDVLLLFRKFASDFAEQYRTEAIRLDDRAEILIRNYSWPGNIRELKNIVEQLSVRTEERIITAEKLLEYAPHLLKRNLPAIPDMGNGNGDGMNMNERELLYKLLFDMKNDLNELRVLVGNIIANNDLQVSEQTGLGAIQLPSSIPFSEDLSYEDQQQVLSSMASRTPIIIQNSGSNTYDEPHEEEENLRIEDMERDLIQKALKKHSGRRKEAANELGISERTLYRKIKEYNLG